jgi:hypothetical protein
MNMEQGLNDNWQAKTEILADKPATQSLRSTQIPHKLPWKSTRVPVRETEAQHKINPHGSSRLQYCVGGVIRYLHL